MWLGVFRCVSVCKGYLAGSAVFMRIFCVWACFVFRRVWASLGVCGDVYACIGAFRHVWAYLRVFKCV